MGCFPLLPFCNRIADRRFVWAGQTFTLAPNFGDHPHAIHGIGWQRPWQVEAVARDAVTLSLHHAASNETAAAWPFAFSARMTYRLTGSRLGIEIEATNLHSAPAPMGIGAHPYFPRAATCAIAFQAAGVWLNRDAIPARHQPVPTAWDHARARPVDGEPLDNCFTGWRRTASLPGLRIDADAVFGNLQVFTPARADFFCVEPVSHVPDAINRTDAAQGQGMAILAPGAVLRGTIAFSPMPL